MGVVKCTQLRSVVVGEPSFSCCCWVRQVAAVGREEPHAREEVLRQCSIPQQLHLRHRGS